MKVRTIILGAQVSAVCAMLLTQGCVTAESQGNGRKPGARLKGVGGHVHYLAKEHQADGMSDPSYLPPSDGIVGGDVIEEGPVIVDVMPESTYTPLEEVKPMVPATSSYILQKGDTLSGVAVMFGTTTRALAELNNLTNPDKVFEGQEIKVPGSGSASKKSYSAPKSSGPKKGGTYTIQQGDSLSRIASRAHVSVADLKAINHLKNDRIIAGETLVIPAYGTVPKGASKAVSTKSKKAKESQTSGETLMVPDALPPTSPTALPPAGAVSTSTPDTTNVQPMIDYLVYPGETLEEIAKRYSVSKSEIMRLNNITNPNANIENRRLQIPIAE